MMSAMMKELRLEKQRKTEQVNEGHEKGKSKSGARPVTEPTTPDKMTFRRVLAELMLEGDLAGVRRIMEEDMPACGVEPDDQIWAQLKVSD